MTDSWKNCPLCEKLFDRQDHEPIALPACGHTYCRKCLIMIHSVRESISCPRCKKLHTGPTPDVLPMNRALLDILECIEQKIGQQDARVSRDSQAKSFLDSEPKDNQEKSFPDSEPKDPPSDLGANNIPSSSEPKDNPSDMEENNSSPESESSKGSKILKCLGYGAAATVGAAGAVAAAPVVLTAAGFTSAGIAAGSLAASMMSLYGGAVTAGSWVAVLQSAGAAGVSAATAAGLAGAGAAAGVGTVKGVRVFTSKNAEKKDEGNGKKE
ncbi:uncharacterized protein [Cherax quadricarinatus]